MSFENTQFSGFDAKPLPLMGIAHGSRNQHSAKVTEQQIQRAANQLGVPGYVAYLEDFAHPSVFETANKIKADGFPGAIAVPLLFTSAYHAKSDVPEAISEAVQETGVEIHLSEVLGLGADLVEILNSQLQSLADSSFNHILFLAVGSSRKGANEEVVGLGESLARRAGKPVEVAFATCEPKANTWLTAQSQKPNFEPESTVVLPLFAAPGLLLDKTLDLAQSLGIKCLPHLGEALCPIIQQRYLEKHSALEFERKL